MKKILLGLTIAVLVSVGLNAQRDPFFPPTATTLGQGGSFTANAEGFNAFFYNPAGFNRKKEFTLASVNVYGTMDKTIFEILWNKLFKGSESTSSGSKGLAPVGRGPDDETGGMDFASLGLPPETVQALEGLQAGLTDVQNYIGDAEGSTPGVTEAALQQTLNDLAAEGLLTQAQLDDITQSIAENETGDLSGVLSQLAPLLAENPALIDQLLGGLVENIGAATGDPYTGELPDFNEALKKAFPSGNLNAGLMAGIGWVGGGLGIGVFANAEAGIYTPEGKSLLGAKGRVLNTFTVVGGLAFKVFDVVDIGFSVRPTILGFADMNVSQFLTSVLGVSGAGGDESADLLSTVLNKGVYKSFRIGVDVGALWDIGPLTLGLAIKDLIPYPMTYTRYDSYTEYLNDLVAQRTGKAVSPDEAKDLYNPLVPKLNIGLQFHPDMGSFKTVLDPRIGLDIYDLLGWIDYLQGSKDSVDPYNFLKTINVGAEIKLLNTISVRAGLNRGALTGGLGVRLLFLDINLAASTVLAPTAADTKTLDFTQVGFAAEVAIRF